MIAISTLPTTSLEVNNCLVMKSSDLPLQVLRRTWKICENNIVVIATYNHLIFKVRSQWLAVFEPYPSSLIVGRHRLQQQDSYCGEGQTHMDVYVEYFRQIDLSHLRHSQTHKLIFFLSWRSGMAFTNFIFLLQSSFGYNKLLYAFFTVKNRWGCVKLADRQQYEILWVALGTERKDLISRL